MAEIKWHSERVIKKVKAVIRPRMGSAMEIVRKAAVKRISQSQPKERIKSGKTAGAWRGKTPAAAAPTPPRVLSNRLRASITQNVSDEGDDIVGRVGTNVEYALRLEKGFSGTDSKGRNFNQKARPYLVPSLEENMTRIAQILTSAR